MKSLWELLYPPRCIFCGKLLKDTDYLCPDCRKSAPWYRKRKTKPQFLDSVTAVWYYKENARDSLLRFKFGNAPQLGGRYGIFLGAVLRQRFPEGFDLITWVPTSSVRRYQRGYDQAEILARAVGRELGMRPRRLLRKIRNNPAQSGISDAAHRRANVMGVYRLTGKAPVEGRRILLIDDILTTGATAGECARVLRQGGAREVHCAVVAASPKD